MKIKQGTELAICLPASAEEQCFSLDELTLLACLPGFFILTGRSNTDADHHQGQVTIPQHVRLRLGLLPHTEVEFELADDHARIRKAKPDGGTGARGRAVLAALRGSADSGMSTDEIMALTRGAKKAR